MSVIETIREKAKTDVKHIVLPEGSEELSLIHISEPTRPY